MPVLVAGAYVHWRGDALAVGLWLLTLVGMVLLHAGANLFNDYFDHLSGADDINRDFISPFSGGARMIQEGLISSGEVLGLSLLCLTAGSIVGLYLALTRGLAIFLLGLVGVGLLFFYTAPPLRLAYRGLGELTVALCFGVLPMLGTEYVLVQRFSDSMLLLSVPMAAMILAVLWVNEFPDASADAQAGKNHLVVLLGRPVAARVLAFDYAIAFGVLALMVAWLMLPAAALWAFVAAVPVAVVLQALFTRPHNRLAWQQACPAGVMAHLLFGLVLFLALMFTAPAPALLASIV